MRGGANVKRQSETKGDTNVRPLMRQYLQR